MSDNSDDQTTVNSLEMDIDALLGGDNVMLPAEDEKKPNMFSRKPEDISFLDKPPVPGDNIDPDDKGAPIPDAAVAPEDIADIVDPPTDEKKTTGRPKVDKAGLVELAKSLIEKKMLVPFDDDKPLEDYSIKDFEELFEANEQEKTRKMYEEIPEKFVSSLPRELQFATDYIMKGGTDMKGLFKSLAAVEETRSLDPSNENDQKQIVRSYLQATRFGNSEEIEEEIDGWADRNELEAKANKFKPKLDALSEKQVQYKLQEQEALRQQQEEQSRFYMDNIYRTLEPGDLNGLKLDKKIQNMLFSGLTQPAYQSVSGKQTNLLGHLLEKYQYIEPNHGLIAEALWLLQDPHGYKEKVRTNIKKEVTAETVRKLKTEEGKRIASHTEPDDVEETKTKTKGLQRPGNFFKRF